MLPKDIFNRHQCIGIDLDETLAQTTLNGIKKLHTMNRMKFLRTLDDVTSFDWTEFPECDMTEEEIVGFWKTHSLLGIVPVENAIFGVAKLFQIDKSIHIITARNEHDHRTDSERWLDIYFPEIHSSHIHFANHLSKHNHAKSTLCKSNKVTLMIDDGLHNALDLAEQGIECILLDMPWNRKKEADHPLIYRVQNWQEIIDNLQV